MVSVVAISMGGARGGGDFSDGASGGDAADVVALRDYVELFEELVGELALGVDAAGMFERHGGNVREGFRELYRQCSG